MTVSNRISVTSLWPNDRVSPTVDKGVQLIALAYDSLSKLFRHAVHLFLANVSIGVAYGHYRKFYTVCTVCVFIVSRRFLDTREMHILSRCSVFAIFTDNLKLQTCKYSALILKKVV